MALKIFQHMQNLLKKSENFTDKEGNIFVHTVLEATENLDPELIGLLLGDEKAKEQFFISVEGALVLNQNKLIEFFTMNEFSKNSYTSYTNKIGLIKKDSFIKKFDNVVLAWPHKDCILEGGQSKDDEKNNEVFYNEILSRDEIDRLFEPKALTDIKRYTHEGVENNPEITEDDNLIIKGNNLIALHGLKKKYAGKVKLIYIDPPYNTGNDSFNYNDKFNHSTWLTFMKNRLEVAKELLRDDGGIFISCDDNEQAYLKVLMDEIFGRDNFIINFAVIRSEGGGLAKQAVKGHDSLLLYAKKIDNFIPLKKPKDIRGQKIIKDDKEYWIEDDWLRKEFGKYGTCHYEEIETIKGLDKKNEIDEGIASGIYELVKKKNGLNAVGRLRLIEEDGTKFYSVLKHLNAAGNSDLENLGFINQFSFPKPVSLLKEIISGATFFSKNKNDIILDFHAGSGTTAHAVLDLNKEDGGNRQFILIEQMDYIETVTCERVKKVIEKNGEGSFIYAELKQIDTFEDAEIGKLNKNMHYLPVSEIEDEEYGISTEEIALNKQFYGLENA